MRPTLPCQLRLRKTVWRIPPSKPSPRSTSPQEQTPLRAAYYRGGTSRALILQPQDLPANHAKWRAIFRQVLGSVGLGEPYGRQLHRLTKGTSSLGKICLVEPYHKTDEKDTTVPHVDYTFVSLDPKAGYVDVASNSGNMLSAIGPYAYNARLLPPDIYAIKDGDITIVIRNTNTMKLIESTFSVSGGQAAVTGKHSVDGVNGKGSSITLAFQDPLRSATSSHFPTGKFIDVIEGHKVTCMDGAIPVVFIRADAIGVPGAILPHALNEQKDKLILLEKIRRAAAVAMGIADDETTVSRTIPKIAVVSQSAQHTTMSGAALKDSQMDIVVRFISDDEPHHAIPLTGALATAMAASMTGTVVDQLLAPEEVVDGVLTIAHPSGRLQVKLDFDRSKKPPMWVGSVSTTAQRLFDGKAYWTDSALEAETEAPTHAQSARHSLGLAFVNELRFRESPENLVERLYKDHNASGSFASRLVQKHSGNRAPHSRPREQPDLRIPAPPTARDETHLLRELGALRTSLTHFTSLYPPPKSPRAKPETPTPANISHHLTAIAQHINILTASLAPMPRASSLRPSKTKPDARKGAQWRQWAKTFSRWDKIRLLREAERKLSRKERKKSAWARWRDGQLRSLDVRGRPVTMGARRERLLEGTEGGRRGVEALQEDKGGSDGVQDGGDVHAFGQGDEAATARREEDAGTIPYERVEWDSESWPSFKELLSRRKGAEKR